MQINSGELDGRELREQIRKFMLFVMVFQQSYK
jgi:hypothetical protein